MADAAGMLLTGGASARLGVSKGDLRCDGERLADRSARILTSVCTRVIEVGPGLTPLPAVREEPPGSGPLAAVAAGGAALAAAATAGPALVLAVDLPFVTEALLTWLAGRRQAGAVVPVVAGRPQPLCARYGPADLVAAARLVGDGAASMRALLDVVTVTFVDEGAWCGVATERTFADVDTPEEARRAGLAWPSTPPG